MHFGVELCQAWGMAVNKRSSRLAVLGTIGAVLFSALGLRLWFLQAVDAPVLEERVQANKSRTVRLLPERGRIFDRDGRILADNERVLTMTMSWEVMRRTADRLELFRRLAPLLEVSPSDLEARYKSNRYSPLLPMPLKEGVSEETAIYLIQRTEDFPGIDVSVQWKRQYPYAPLAAHVIGYLGAITADDSLQYRELGYDLNERVGQFGVEKSFEPYLRGAPGYVKYEVDSRGAILDVVERKEPVPGYDLQLAIDLDFQQLAEMTLETQLRIRSYAEVCQQKKRVRDEQESLLRGRDVWVLDEEQSRIQERDVVKLVPVIESARIVDENGQEQMVPVPPCSNYISPAGSVVMMDYSTGQVNAIASYPTFDNRWFNSGVDSEKFSQIFPRTDDPNKSILVNRAVQGQYNLGSSFKPFVAFAALNTGQLPGGVDYRFEDRYVAGKDRNGSPIWNNGAYFLRYGPNCNASAQDGPQAQQGDIDTSTGRDRRTGAKCVYRNALCGSTNRPCFYGTDIDVEDALAVSVDTFFYKIGEELFEERRAPDPRNPGQTVQPFLLQQEVRRFGFGARTGIDLPFESAGRVPDQEEKNRLAERYKAFEAEREYSGGDNVLLAIGQGLLAASPLQLAQGYGTLANGGEVNRPLIALALLEPGTPNAVQPGFADVSRANVYLNLGLKDTIRTIDMPAEFRDPIVRGLSRVITGPGVTSDYYHSTTGEKLFERYPYDLLPIAGKTGTAQGYLSLPWYDSSVFAAFSLDPTRPVVVSAYLEKAGFGSRAAAPVAKCMLMGYAGAIELPIVQLSNPLDINSTRPTPQRELPDRSCLSGATLGGRD